LLDATLCSEAGLPSTVVVTTPFRGLAELTAKGAGLPDFGFVVVEHPVWTRNDAWIEAAADKLAESIAVIFAAGSVQPMETRTDR
jgi:hypothetical protein